MGIRFRARAQRLAVAALSAATFTSVLRAEVVDVTWLGGTGSWNDPRNWSGGYIPNNGGGFTYRVFVPTGSVNQGLGTFTIDSLHVDAGASVAGGILFTVTGEAEINGIVSAGNNLQLGAPGTLSGSGKIVVTHGKLFSTGALEIPVGFNIEIAPFGGATIGSPDRPTINRGRIYGGIGFGNFRTVVTGSSISNLGTIEAINGCIAFGGTFTRADLGTLVWGSGGTFGVAGTLINTNQTLQVDSTEGWELNNGTIQGGTIQVAPGSELRTILTSNGSTYRGTLDNVIVNGHVAHRGSSTLNISNGALKGDADIFLGPGPIEGPCRLVSTSGALTIQSTVLVHGGGVFAGGTNPSGVGDGSGAVINHGTIRAERVGQALTGQLNILGTSVFNDGILTFAPAGTLYVAGASGTPTTLTFGAGGVLDARTLLTVVGQLDLSTAGDIVQFTTTPASFQRFVTTSGGVIGQFDIVPPNYELMYTPTEIFFRFVPEPGTGCLIALLAAPLLHRRRGIR